MSKTNLLSASTMSILLVGTGSSYSTPISPQWEIHLKLRADLDFENFEIAHARIDIRTAAEHLENIRLVLNLSVSELADFFDVSRQAIYKWLSRTSTPESQTLEQVKALSLIADAFSKAEIYRIGGAMLYIKAENEQSLMDLLKARKPHEKQLKELIAEAKLRKTAHGRLNFAQSKAPATDDWLSSFAVRTYREDL